jgi:hypothetical protein
MTNIVMDVSLFLELLDMYYSVAIFLIGVFVHPDDRVAHRLTESREMINVQKWRWKVSDDKQKSCLHVLR